MDNEAKILTDNAAALYSQLSSVDGAFYHCMHYKSLGTLSEASKAELIDFVHPVSLQQPMLDKMLTKVHYSSTSRNNIYTVTPTLAPTTTSGVIINNKKSKTPAAVQNINKVPLLSSRDYDTYLLSMKMHLIDELCAKKAI